MRVVGKELAFELLALDFLDRPHRQQRVDEEPVALRRRHAPGGRVRARDETHFLEVRHDVADGGGRKLERREARERPRAYRLAVGDVSLDQDLQQVLGTVVQHLSNLPRCYATTPILTVLRALIPPMKAAFKTVGIVGKSDAASLREVDRLSGLLNRRNVKVIADPLTSEVPPDSHHRRRGATGRCSRPRGSWPSAACRSSASTSGGWDSSPTSRRKDLEQAIGAILDGDYSAEERMLLSGSVTRGTRRSFPRSP
jgi:hypothetical protein